MHIFKFTLIPFAISLFLVSCKLDKPILPGDPGYVKSTPPGDTTSKGSGNGTGTGTTTTATYYVKGTLNGKAFDWEVDEATWGTGNGKNSSTDQQGVETAELQGVISSYTSTQSTPAISIGIRTYQVNLNNQDEASIITYFNGFVTAGNWTLATDNVLTPGSKKIVIYYSDANGNNYSSEGVQTGNSANITSVKQVPASLGTKESIDIKLTFSCKLYNLDGSGSSLTLNNAQASINIPDQLY